MLKKLMTVLMALGFMFALTSPAMAADSGKDKQHDAKVEKKQDSSDTEEGMGDAADEGENDSNTMDAGEEN